MTPTTLAAALLKDVPTDALAKIIYGAMRFERQNETPEWVDGGNAIAQDEARRAAAKAQDVIVATLSRALDPAIAERAGEVLERLQKADEYEPLGHDGWDAADLITALLAQNAALQAQAREMAMDVLAASGQAQEAYQAQLAAEEKLADWLSERDALRTERDTALGMYLRSSDEGFRQKARAEAAEAQVEKLRGAADWQEKQRRDAFARRHINAPEDPHVAALCERYGYGAVMDAASRLWARKDSVGAFYIGGCIGIKPDAALTTEADNG